MKPYRPMSPFPSRFRRAESESEVKSYLILQEKTEKSTLKYPKSTLKVVLRVSLETLKSLLRDS